MGLSGLPNSPSLRRRTEQALAAHPAGIGWRALIQDVTWRAVAAGHPAPGVDEVAREVSGLITEGRLDERGGWFVLRAVCGPPRVTSMREAA